jgi:hypothetical protein
MKGALSFATLGRKDGLWLVAPVAEVDPLAHILAAGLGVHQFTENLQAVAVRVEEDVLPCQDWYLGEREYTLSDTR